MNKQEFTYPSSNGVNQIHAVAWYPEGTPKAILQIVHGMVEYVERYEDFAVYMANQGFLVCGEDHLGHGGSAGDDGFGYFGQNGNAHVIADIGKLRAIMQEKHPELPYTMLGHSMGSFLTRQYIMEGDPVNSEGLSGVIIMGTGWTPAPVLKMGMAVTGLLGAIRGNKHRSNLVEAMAFGSYNKRIENNRTPKDWLTKVDEIVDENLSNPWSNYRFTVNAYYNMFKGISKAQDTSLMAKLPEGMKILLVAGTEDPVGNYGEGVRKTFMELTEKSPCDVDIIMYEGDRHEILNETDREDVYKDILEWLNACI